MITEIVYSVLAYAMFSITKWVVHKYKTPVARCHIVHHIHTLPNMKLIDSPIYGQTIDKYLGLYCICYRMYRVFHIKLYNGIECICLFYDNICIIFLSIPDFILKHNLSRYTRNTLFFISSLLNNEHPIP